LHSSIYIAPLKSEALPIRADILTDKERFSGACETDQIIGLLYYRKAYLRDWGRFFSWRGPYYNMEYTSQAYLYHYVMSLGHKEMS